MQFGLHVAQLGALGEPAVLVDLAGRAEAAGWDGFFVGDHVIHRTDPPACDPWVALGAIAAEPATDDRGRAERLDALDATRALVDNGPPRP